jgi:hypothetical protein
MPLMLLQAFDAHLFLQYIQISIDGIMEHGTIKFIMVLCLLNISLASIVVVHIAKYISSLWAMAPTFQSPFQNSRYIMEGSHFLSLCCTSESHQDHVQRKLCIKNLS